VLFPARPGSTTPRALASVRYVRAASLADADTAIRADYRARGIAVLAVRSFGTL
jgi:hypothetical protein